MQKVLRRSLLARNQSLRRQRLNARKSLLSDRLDNTNEVIARNSDLIAEVRAERRNRREDFALGPIAPRRDIGEYKEAFGTRRLQHARAIPVEKRKRAEYLNFAIGDRVCVVRGLEAGKIGKVTEVDEDSQTVRVEGVNQVDLKTYDFQNTSGTMFFQTQELPLSLEDVRLVIPMRNPQTQEIRDVVIRNMYGSGPKIERHSKSSLPKHTRYVSGVDMEIPWPEEEIEEQETYQADTPRIHVESQTWMPTLVDPPMPWGIIDELRNPYDRLRNDHEAEFMEKKLLEDLKTSHLAKQRLITPETEYWEKQAAEKANARPRTVSEETLRLIAETQALNLGK